MCFLQCEIDKLPTNSKIKNGNVYSGNNETRMYTGVMKIDGSL